MLDSATPDSSDRINIVIPLFNDWPALTLLPERFRAVVDQVLVSRLTFLVLLRLVFIVLSYRTQPQFIPARQFQDFVERVEEVY